MVGLVSWLLAALWTCPSATANNLAAIRIEPAAAGEQLVRASLPFGPGQLRLGQQLLADDGQRRIVTAVRPLGWHRDSGAEQSIRQALVTFPYRFASLEPITLRLVVSTDEQIPSPPHSVSVEAHGPAELGGTVDFESTPRAGTTFWLRLPVDPETKPHLKPYDAPNTRSR